MAFTGNSNYAVATYTAFAVEKAVAKEWTSIYTQNHPLLIALADKGTNFNTGFTVQGNTKIIIPILGDDLTTPAAGVTDANELTADTLSVSNGFSQAAYEIAHYRANQTYRESELMLAANGARGDFLGGKSKQVIESFKNRWSTDASSATVDSRSKVMGVRYALSTSNTVGGISQTTDTNWAANVKTSAGTFGLSLIDDQVDLINSKGRGSADLILASVVAGSGNMFGKIRTAIGPTAERLVNVKDGFGRYGLQDIEYLGAKVVNDSRGTAGEILVLSTATWFVMMPKAPKAHGMERVQGTDAYHQTWTLWSTIGLNDPGSNSRIAGVSA